MLPHGLGYGVMIGLMLVVSTSHSLICWQDYPSFSQGHDLKIVIKMVSLLWLKCLICQLSADCFLLYSDHNFKISISFKSYNFQSLCHDKICYLLFQVDSLVADNVEIQQMGKLAYKKFVRSYQCHKLKKVFNIQELDLKEVCRAFGFTLPPVELGNLT